MLEFPGTPPPRRTPPPCHGMPDPPNLAPGASCEVLFELILGSTHYSIPCASAMRLTAWALHFT